MGTGNAWRRGVIGEHGSARGLRYPGLFVIGGAACIGALVFVGCSSSTQQSRTFEMESPRASGGTVIEGEDTAEGLDRIAAALDEIETPEIPEGVLESIQRRIAESQMEQVGGAAEVQPAALIQDEDTDSGIGSEDVITIPPDAGRLISLNRMSLAEIKDLIASLSLKLQAEKGYLAATAVERERLGRLPDGVGAGPVIWRRDAEGAESAVRFGFVSYVSQKPQLWVQGVVIGSDGVVSANPDLEPIQGMVDSSLAQVQQMRDGLAQTDLDRKLVQLSYVNADGAVKALKGLGIQTVPSIEGLPAKIEFNQLPMVTKMPVPTDKQIGLVGASESKSGAFGQTTTPTSASPLESEVYVGPTSQLMVLFHPAHPEQFSLVRSLLDEYVDRAARQVFIEGMVLEISETGLEELGVEWSFKRGTVDLLLGSLDPTGVTDTVTFSSLDSRDVPLDWGAQIRALVREGKAEILSRPSVLTLNNRQATIRVGEDLPIATSQEGVLNNSNKVAFNFKYIPTGILLNIRPRIAEAGDEVSMLIDTLVSAQVPGRDLEIRSQQGELLASAPTISTRRVQTYARIDDTTPFIIGGLVSRDRSVTKDKVPLLGDLPLLGPLFRSESTQTQKREVIIVLTPYVLPEDQAVSRALPRDDDLFDNTGNQLFRDSFRIRADDVFDLRFLVENKRLMIYRDLAKHLLTQNYDLAKESPFDEFVDDTIPGEEILIQRMIYEVIKRTGVGQQVNPERIIYFEAKEYEGYDVRFLNYALARLGNGVDAESFFTRNTGKAIAITYNYARESLSREDLASEPIPEISLVDCPNRDVWQQLLWDMNQPSDDGLDRYTILIHEPEDIVRLQRALMLKKIVMLNGEEEALSLANFSIGKTLHVPSMGPDKVSVVDADVARYFFHTELYYAAIINRIEEVLGEFDRKLQTPEVGMYLESVE
ncbi:MAG: hypothetical protein JJ974_10965 [Phycisphaerales bacterium]|nr:hypothetical protein [Phycisphaerales bacterium]